MRKAFAQLNAVAQQRGSKRQRVALFVSIASLGGEGVGSWSYSGCWIWKSLCSGQIIQLGWNDASDKKFDASFWSCDFSCNLCAGKGLKLDQTVNLQVERIGSMVDVPGRLDRDQSWLSLI